jgi:hypothetical protein
MEIEDDLFILLDILFPVHLDIAVAVTDLDVLAVRAGAGLYIGLGTISWCSQPTIMILLPRYWCR